MVHTLDWFSLRRWVESQTRTVFVPIRLQRFFPHLFHLHRLDYEARQLLFLQIRTRWPLSMSDHHKREHRLDLYRISLLKKYLWKYVLMKTSALKDGSEQALNGENKSSFLFFLQIDFPSFSSIFPTLHPAQCFISTSLGKTNSDIFHKDTIVTMVVNNRQIKWPLPQH